MGGRLLAAEVGRDTLTVQALCERNNAAPAEESQTSTLRFRSPTRETGSGQREK